MVALRLTRSHVLAAIATLTAAVTLVVTIVVAIAAWVITVGWLKLIVLFVLIQP